MEQFEMFEISYYYDRLFKRDLKEYFIGSTLRRIPRINNVNTAFLQFLSRKGAILMPIMFYIQIVFQKTVIEMFGIEELEIVTRKLKLPIIMDVANHPDVDVESLFSISRLEIIRPEQIDEPYKEFVWNCAEMLYKDIEINLQGNNPDAYIKYASLKEECESRACDLLCGRYL